jgi:putative ABC transport system permease protein
MIGIAIGIASVILLTSLGEGTRRYMVDQFSQFGTNIIAINPGKADTVGLPGIFGGTTQKLTIDDNEALYRIPGVEEVAPFVFGMARVEGDGRGRSVFVYGVTPEFEEVWKWRVRSGSLWPGNDPPLPGHRRHGAEGSDAGFRPGRRGVHTDCHRDEGVQSRRAQ